MSKVLRAGLFALPFLIITPPALADPDKSCPGDAGPVIGPGQQVNANVVVPAGMICIVDGGRINGNVTVHGNFRLIGGGRVNGNVTLIDQPPADSAVFTHRGEVRGNVKAASGISLGEESRTRGNVIFDETGGTFEIVDSRPPGEMALIWGNLEINGDTTAIGNGDARFFGNVICNANVFDMHTGTITADKKENCPPTF